MNFQNVSPRAISAFFKLTQGRQVGNLTPKPTPVIDQNECASSSFLDLANFSVDALRGRGTLRCSLKFAKFSSRLIFAKSLRGGDQTLRDDGG